MIRLDAMGINYKIKNQIDKGIDQQYFMSYDLSYNIVNFNAMNKVHFGIINDFQS